MNINAVTAEKPVVNIDAAVAGLPRDVKRLMAHAGVNLGAKKLTVADLDAQFRASPRPLSAESRMAIKISLDRAQLLA
jgi:hypothetical protein